MDDRNAVEIVSWLLVTRQDNYNRQQIAMKKNFPLTSCFSSGSGNKEELKSSFSFLSKEFPPDIFLMNLDYYQSKSEKITFRVNNLRQKKVFEFFDEPQLQQGFFPYSELYQELSLHNLFSKDIQLSAVEERSLSLNRKVEDCKRHHWHELSESMHDFKTGDTLFEQTGPVTNKVVPLPPLSIRSFFIMLTKN